MKRLSLPGRQLAESFTREGLPKFDATLDAEPFVRELRDAGLNWIEHHTERKLKSREFLDAT
jgi:hypothetical protein